MDGPSNVNDVLDLLDRKKSKQTDAKYNITITCMAYRNDGGVESRGLIYKVYEAIYKDPLSEVMDHKGSFDWEIVLDPRLFMNGDFLGFEKIIKELYYEDLKGDATLTIRLMPFISLLEVSRKYMTLHGFSTTNVPWVELADFYKNSKPQTKDSFRRKFGRTDPSGFGEYAERSAPGSGLDVLSDRFSPEELSAAEKVAQILEDSAKAP